MEGKTGITIGTCAAARAACHAYRTIRMPGTVFVVMKSDYDYREKENERKKEYYFLAVQY
jgi:cobalamin biosynthesis protein CbiD